MSSLASLWPTVGISAASDTTYLLCPQRAPPALLCHAHLFGRGTLYFSCTGNSDSQLPGARIDSLFSCSSALELMSKNKGEIQRLCIFISLENLGISCCFQGCGGCVSLASVYQQLVYTCMCKCLLSQ